MMEFIMIINEDGKKGTFRDVLEAFKGDPELQGRGKLSWVAEDFNAGDIDMCHFLMDNCCQV